MQCIFQEDKGEIPELKGMTFSDAKSLHYNDNNDFVYLLLKDSIENSWYKVFHDPLYAHVMKLTEEEYLDNAKDMETRSLYSINHSEWFESKICRSADVTYDPNSDFPMILRLEFSDESFMMLKMDSKDHEELTFLIND